MLGNWPALGLAPSASICWDSSIRSTINTAPKPPSPVVKRDESRKSKDSEESLCPLIIPHGGGKWASWSPALREQNSKKVHQRPEMLAPWGDHWFPDWVYGLPDQPLLSQSREEKMDRDGRTEWREGWQRSYLCARCLPSQGHVSSLCAGGCCGGHMTSSPHSGQNLCLPGEGSSSVRYCGVNTIWVGLGRGQAVTAVE